MPRNRAVRVHVVVRFLAGDTALESDFDPQCCIADVKAKIERQHSIPPAFQKLFQGTEEILDDDWVDKEEYGLVVSLEHTFHELEHGDERRRKQALRNLGFLGGRGGERAIAAAAGALGDALQDVRNAAIAALLRIVPSGSREALPLVFEHLKSKRLEVRASAIYALAQLAECGDSEVLAQLGPCFEDKEPMVRLTAAIVARKLALRGDREVCAAVSTLCRDEVLTVRNAATATLEHLKGRGR